MRLSLLILFFIHFVSTPLNAIGAERTGLFISKEKSVFQKSQKFKLLDICKNQVLNQRPSPLFKLFHDKQKRNKKITAAVLAFPFPFGIVGLHRIYLGCPPYVPVVYIGTFGGVFGALPLIDFFVIVFDKNFENYLNNPQVFMWIK